MSDERQHTEEKKNRGQALKKYGLLFGAFLVYSFVAICSKLAAGQTSTFKIILYLGLEVVFLGVYALIWQQALKYFPLVTAMACKGFVVILNLLWSILLFHESVNVLNVIGAGAIVFGIWVVAEDG